MMASAKFYSHDLAVVHLTPGDTWTVPADAFVLLVWYEMVGAGATSDTIQLTDGTTAITDAVDVSAKGDKAIGLVGTIDDAVRSLTNGKVLTSVPVSSALADLFVLLALSATD
jgi:hypothetical protein